MASLLPETGFWQGMADAVVGQGDLRPGDLNVGTRGRPSAKDGRITDYGHHFQQALMAQEKAKKAAKLLRQDEDF